MQIPLLFTQFLKGNKLNEMWHMIQITLNAYFRQFLKRYLFHCVRFLVYLTECCTLIMHGSHTLIKIPSHFTQFLAPIHVASTSNVSVEQRSIRILHVNHVREPHVNPDFFRNVSVEQRSIRILHVNHVREPHVNPDFFTSETVSQRK